MQIVTEIFTFYVLIGLRSPWYDLHSWLGVKNQLSFYVFVLIAAPAYRTPTCHHFFTRIYPIVNSEMCQWVRIVVAIHLVLLGYDPSRLTACKTATYNTIQYNTIQYNTIQLYSSFQKLQRLLALFIQNMVMIIM